MTNSIIQWAIRLLGGITKEQWTAALKFVANVAARRLSSEEKRAEVLSMLDKIGIRGSKANWLVETAYRWLQRMGGIDA